MSIKDAKKELGERIIELTFMLDGSIEEEVHGITDGSCHSVTRDFEAACGGRIKHDTHKNNCEERNRTRNTGHKNE